MVATLPMINVLFIGSIVQVKRWFIHVGCVRGIVHLSGLCGWEVCYKLTQHSHLNENMELAGGQTGFSIHGFGGANI